MISIRENQLYKLFCFFSKKRKKQLYFLIILLILNGLIESFSIAIIIPFISLIALRDQGNKIPVLDGLQSLIGINNFSQSSLLITILFCLLITLSTFLRIFNIKYIIQLTAKLEIDLSKIIFKNNIYQSYVSYTKKSSSKVIDVTVSKVSESTSALSAFLTLFGSSILGLFIIGSLLFINSQVVILGVIFLAFYYLIIYKKVKNILSSNGRLLASQGPLRLRLMQEVFHGFRDVIVNGTEKIYINLFEKIDPVIKLRTASSNFITAYPRYLVEGIVFLVLAIVGYKISTLDLNIIGLIPILGSTLYAFQKLLPLVQQVYATWATYRTRYPSICEVVKELENNKNTKEFYNYTSKDLTFKKDIVFKNVNFSYDNSREILKDLNFKIKKGNHVGIYGETGSGKSTFLDILIGLIPPTNGKILIDDENIYEKNLNFNWTSKISHVSQNIFLKEGTIAENIAYGQPLERINFSLLEKVSKTAQIYEFIITTQYGFRTEVGERGIRLSGGQRQRIAIARALYKSKEILILDEATSALDNKTEEAIINSIKMHDNITIFMVTHRLKSLRVCDRVFKVFNKKLVEEKNIIY